LTLGKTPGAVFLDGGIFREPLGARFRVVPKALASMSGNLMVISTI